MASGVQSASLFRPWEHSLTSSTASSDSASPVIMIIPADSSPLPADSCLHSTESSPSNTSSIQSSPASFLSNDSGIFSDGTPTATPSPAAVALHRSRAARLFSADVISVLDHWYNLHVSYPYPTPDDCRQLARQCNITPAQVRKWMANKRCRSNNVTAYSVALTRRRLAKKHSPVSRHSAYTASQPPYAASTLAASPQYAASPSYQMHQQLHCYTASPAHHPQAAVSPAQYHHSILPQSPFYQQQQQQEYMQRLILATPLYMPSTAAVHGQLY